MSNQLSIFKQKLKNLDEITPTTLENLTADLKSIDDPEAIYIQLARLGRTLTKRRIPSGKHFPMETQPQEVQLVFEPIEHHFSEVHRFGNPHDEESRYMTLQRQVAASKNFCNHTLLAKSIRGEEFKTFAIAFSKDLLKEMNCQNAAEASLVHIIVNAYIRILKLTTRLEDYIDWGTPGRDENRHFETISKELERAERQYITAFTTLLRLKSPKGLSVSVKTNNAFISGNQQLNSLTENIDIK